MIKPHGFSLCLVLVAALLTTSCAPADSNQPAIQIATVAITEALEGNSGQSNLSFRVSSDIEQAIQFRTVNITAASNSDYINTSGEWSIRPGIAQVVDVPVLGDLQVEADEQVGLLLTYSDGSTSRHTGTIINDDRPAISVADQRLAEGPDGSSVMRFNIALSQTTLTPFPIRIVTEDVLQSTLSAETDDNIQPAEGGVDYQSVDKQVIIQTGANQATFDVVIFGDTAIEAGEAFSAKVFDGTANPLTDTPLDKALGFITNDDGPGFNMPEVALNNNQRQEGQSGNGNTLSFPLSLNGPNDVSFSIFYEVIYPDIDANGFTPADANDLLLTPTRQKYMDIDGSGGTISLNDSLVIPVSGDNQYESNEYFELVLTTDSGFELSRARGVIQNDDSPRFVLNQVNSTEGNSGTSTMRFTLTLDEPEPLAESITFAYVTREITSPDVFPAISGIDYSYTSGNLTFSPGDTSKTIDVPIVGDTIYENNEAFTLQINTLAAVPVIAAIGLIENDDTPRLDITPTNGYQINEGLGTLTFNASFARGVTQDTRVYWVISSGGSTEINDADITSTTMTGNALYLENNTTSADLPASITVVDDNLVEDTESFSISFYGSQADATNNRAALNQSRIFINDNDTVLVEFSATAFRGREGNTEGSELELSSMESSEPDPVLRVYNGSITESTTVNMTVINTGTAETDDYRFPAGNQVSITIPSGDYTTAQTFPISDFFVLSDNTLENDETVTLSLVNTSSTGLGIGASDSLTVTIENDDGLEVGFSSSSDILANENSPATIPSLTATTAVAGDYDPLSPGGEALTVTLDMLNPGDPGQAERVDFTPSLPAQLSISDFPIAIGDVLNVTLPTLLNDDLVELTETATLALSALPATLTTVDITRDQVTYTITSDDSITLTLDETPVSVNEGENADIPIQITGGRLNADSPVLNFGLTIESGSASSVTDYNFGDGTVTVPGENNYSPGLTKSDWLDGLLIINLDGVVEAPQTITLALEAISQDLSSVLNYTDGAAMVTITINSNDTLNVGFQSPQFESFENSQEPDSAVVVDGTTEIDVTLEFDRTGGESYPAAESNDVDIATITVDPSHVSGNTFEFPAAARSDNTLEFNEEMTVRFRTAAETGEPINLLAQNQASWLLLNDDLTLLINGSGIDYCADAAGVIDADCSTIVDANLQSQDGKLATPPFSASPPLQSGSDNATPTVNWLCRTDAITELTWAFEDSATPTLYQDSAVDQKITDMNGVCGVSDWRRPTFNELSNLMVFTSETGLLDTATFPNVQVAASTDQYWFKESNSSATAMLMSFHQGQIMTGTDGFLMLVSDSQSPLVPNRPTPTYACAEDTVSLDPGIQSDYRYTVSAGQITDNLTGLTWASRSLLTSDSNANPSWATALEQADTYGGESADSTGWRAPTIKELLSLVTLNCDSTGLVVDTNLPHYFLPNMPGGVMLPLMSSSPVNNANGEVWTLNLATESQMIAPSPPPSGGPAPVAMQTFVVRAP